MAIREPAIDMSDTAQDVAIGLAADQRSQVAQLLNTLLADLHVILTKTRNFHWNLTGPQFAALHTLFETQYDALIAPIDEVAERVRMVGGYAAGTMKEFCELTRLGERPGWYPDARQMVAELLQNYETTVQNLREDVDRAADDLHDEGTADLLIGILRHSEKTAWMLRATLEGWA